MSPENLSSSAVPFDSNEQTKTSSIESQWYKPDIGPRLKPSTKAVYENWSDITGDELTRHLYNIRDKAWQHLKYPCIGEWMFLLSSISGMNEWPDILERARNGATILDLGCSFGQNLRLLAANGVETANMYAIDISNEIWDLGFDLFRDRNKMKAKFIHSNFLDSPPILQQLDGKMDIILVCQFLHLFNQEQQYLATKNIVKFSRPGSVVIGYQRAHPQTSNLVRPYGIMYLHSLDTFRDMWDQAARETGTEWRVEVEMVDLADWGLEKEDCEWMPSPWTGINFMVTRET